MITSNGYQLDESLQRMGDLQPVPARERNDRSALWERLRREGYLYLTNQLPPEVVEAFREYYFASLEPSGLLQPGSDPRDGLGQQGVVDREVVRRVLMDDIVPGERYSALTSHPAVKDWFQWFLGDDVHLHKRKIIRHIRPGEAGIGTATQAHYDLVYLREGTDRVLSMWIPIGDCPVEMGGLTYLERSHHWAMAEERSGTLHLARAITADLPALAERRDSRWLLADYKAGDVVVHSAYIVHAATDNVDAANRIRLSTDIRYQRATEPIDWRWQEHWFEGDGL